MSSIILTLPFLIIHFHLAHRKSHRKEKCKYTGKSDDIDQISINTLFTQELPDIGHNLMVCCANTYAMSNNANNHKAEYLHNSTKVYLPQASSFT